MAPHTPPAARGAPAEPRRPSNSPAVIGSAASFGRRAVVSGLFATLATPITARAQRRDAARIVLFIDEGDEPYETAFREGLASLGWVEGRTLTIDRRPLAEGKLDPVGGIAAAVLQGRVDAFVVPGDGAARQVRQATPLLPIVVAAGTDLVSSGLANSTAHPGGNVTGLHVAHPEMGVRRLALLQEMIPGLTQVGVVFSAPPSRSRATAAILEQIEVAARARQIAVQIQTVAAPDKFTPAFGALARAHVGAMLVSSDTFMSMHRGALAEAALRSRLPTMLDHRAFVEAGGLMSYGPNLADLWRRAASHVDRILKGAKAGDLPVESPTRFELVLNGATARALGLAIPASLRKKADHVLKEDSR